MDIQLDLTKDPMYQAHLRATARLDALKDPSPLVRQMIITSEVMQSHSKNDFRYKTYYEAVLELGTERDMDHFYIPDEIPPGEPKMCYINAGMIALENERYTYCEGYACTNDLGIAMSHAWLEDEEGNLIDSTWGSLEREPEGASYYGIKFSREYLMMRWNEHPTHFGGVLGEDYGYYSHMINGMVLDENGVVVGEVSP